MLVDKITLEQALILERKGEITIYDSGRKNIIGYHEREHEWKNNFYHLRTKARTVSREKVPQHFYSRYIIEVNIGCINPHTRTFHWKYLRGIENTTNIESKSPEIEYVYVLTNKNHKDLVKIGMTRFSPEKRLEQINSTGVVYSWELKFAFPTSKDAGVKVEKQVHKAFQHLRYHSKNYNDREMFKIDVFQAIDKIREVGVLFQAGSPILY